MESWKKLLLPKFFEVHPQPENIVMQYGMSLAIMDRLQQILKKMKSAYLRKRKSKNKGKVLEDMQKALQQYELSRLRAIKILSIYQSAIKRWFNESNEDGVTKEVLLGNMQKSVQELSKVPEPNGDSPTENV